MAKDFYSASLTSETVPPTDATTTAAGTIVAGSKVIVGTDLDELNEGDWIVDIPNLERRKVLNQQSSTRIEINKPFTNATALSTLVIVRADICAAVYMQITPVGSITVDGVAVLDAAPVDFGNKNDSATSTKFIKPRIVAGSVVVNLEYFDNEFAD